MPWSLDLRCKRCHAPPQQIFTKGISIYRCDRCRLESITQEDRSRNLYAINMVRIDTAKLEPAFKIVEVTEGPIKYLKSVPLDEKELLRFHYGKDVVWAEEKQKLSSVQIDIPAPAQFVPYVPTNTP